MRQNPQKRFHSWSVRILTFLLVFVLGIPAMAAPAQPLTLSQKIELLRQYQVVRGDEKGNLNLEKPIKRAEMVAIIIRAMGKDSFATSFQGLGLFSDSKGHWADGYLSYGRSIGLVIGDGDNRARPEDPVSYAEALTLILRAVEHEPTSGDWPSNILIAASGLNLVPPNVNYSNFRAAAVRGDIFGSLADGLVEVTNKDGKSYLQAYLNATGPSVTLESLPAQTADGSVLVKGKAPGAASVTINGVSAVLVGGSFEGLANLQVGSNSITVTASDLAGITSTKQVTVNRTTSIAGLSIEGPAGLGLGQTGSYQVTAVDANGNTVSTAGVIAQVEGNIGTFDIVTGVFKATNSVGSGKIVVTAGSVSASISVKVSGTSTSVTGLGFRPINGGNAVAYTKPMTVQVEMRNADGELVADDNGRSVTLTATGTGVTVSPAIANTVGGVATFTVKKTTAGSVALSASSSGLSTVQNDASFGTSIQVRLVTDPTSMVVGGNVSSARLRAELRDDAGNLVMNTSNEDILIELTATGSDGTVDDRFLTIRRDTTTSTASGDDGLYSLGSVSGTVTISGRMISSHKHTIDTARINVTKPTLGSGSRFVVVPPNVFPEPNQTGTYLIRVEDGQGNLVSGSYAFQVSVKTSNGETGADLADSVTVSLGGWNPVSDGKPEGSTSDGADVIGRTRFGAAALDVTYDKPGIVTLTVTGASATTTAYDDDGNPDSAVSGAGLAVGTTEGIWYTNPTQIKLTADSEGFGKDQSVGAASKGNRTVTIHAYAADNNGYWIPRLNGDIELVKAGDNVTKASGSLIGKMKDGQATFTVTTTSTVGSDTYTPGASVKRFTNGPPIVLNGGPFTVQVDGAVPEANTILFARGHKPGQPGAENFVAPDDENLELELAQDPNQKWVVVQVYSGNTNTLLYTSPPTDLSDFAPKVLIPKDKLRENTANYSVIVRNGFGNSGRSNLSNPITNASYSSTILVSGGRYDAVTGLFYISGSGFAAGATLTPSLLTIVDPFNINGVRTELDLTNASVQGAITSSNITLNVSGVPGISDLEDGELFSGTDVRLEASQGWYVAPTGSIAQADLGSNPVTPMAYVAYGMYDGTNNRLTLVGAGFNSATIAWDKVTLSDNTKLSTLSPVKVKDSEWKFTVNYDVSNLTLNLADGWAKTGTTASSPAQLGAVGIPIYTQVKVTSISYVVNANNEGVLTLNGSGFTGGTVDLSKIAVKDLSTGKELDLTGALVTNPLTSDTKIVITLTTGPTGQTQAYKVKADYSGSDNYVVAQESWFIKGGKSGAPILVPTLRMPTIAP